MSGKQSEIDALGAQFFAISTDDFSGTSFIPDRPEVKFPILYDASRETVEKYGVLNGKLAHPATFVIDAGGVIRWKRVNENYTNRPAVETVLAQVRELVP